MDKNTKEKWLEALRSGRYRQGRDQLRQKDAFCCLGVLCDVVDPDGWTGGGRANFRHRGNISMPPAPVSERIDSVTAVQRLVDMNDRGVSFETIADYIEKNL